MMKRRNKLLHTLVIRNEKKIIHGNKHKNVHIVASFKSRGTQTKLTCNTRACLTAVASGCSERIPSLTREHTQHSGHA